MREWAASRAGQLALAAPLLAVGFACMFDAVMLLTAWQHLRQRAAVLAERAASAGAAGPNDGMEFAFAAARLAAAPTEMARSGVLVLRLFGPGGTALQQWTSGTLAPASLRPPPSGCPNGAFVADLQLPVSGWLVAGAAVRALLPTLRASHVACLRPAAPPPSGQGR